MLNRAARQQQVWIVSGPSGSGKTTLCEALLKEDCWEKKLLRSVSFTTRPRRKGERQGRDYYFIDETEFEKLKRENAFLEHEKIFGFYYGTCKNVLLDAQKQGKDVLLCIDVKGAEAVKKTLQKNTVSIFVVAPELDILVERLHKRSTENKKDIEKRVGRVKMEVSYAAGYDYVIINDRFDEALTKLKAILTAKKCEGAYVLYSVGKTD